MKLVSRICVCLLLFLPLTMLNGQFYNTGSAPYSVKWRSINTEHFKLIYPTETETLAQKYASTLDQLYPHTSHTLNHQPGKVDVIMYNQSILSNAYVVWAPKRVEVVTTSPQKQYAHDWMEQLALHEYRHVVQVDKLNQGFTKGLSYLSGEMGVGAMMAFIPLWFLEGDAVVTETALTQTGRGRDPNFIQETMAAELQQPKRFTYDEFYLGSYKHNVPNHYSYGYHMSAWSRQKFGAEIWDTVLNNVGRRPFVIAPFFFKLKQQTGLSKVDLYNHAYDDLGKKWKTENASRQVIDHSIDSIETSYKSKFVSYSFPYVQSDSSILALRTSIDDRSKIVELKNGTEKVLLRLGSFQGSKVSYSPQYIAWEEVQYDPRWERKNYSVIRIFNRKTGKSEVLKYKERHFAPEISPTSKQICLINEDALYHSYLELYDIESKLLVNRYAAGKGRKLSYPSWLGSNKIAVVVLSEKGKSIELLNTETGEWEEILKAGFENISYLHGNNNLVYFSYTYDGRVNIYRINLDQGNKLERICSTQIGVNYPSVDSTGQTLTFSEYTSEGYKPRTIQLAQAQVEALENIQPYRYQLAESMASQETINIQDSILPLKQYESKPYSKWLHSFNIHSWLVPFYVPLDDLPDQDTKLYPGLTLLSQNSLSTVTSTLSYYYKDGYHHLRPTLAFRMLYPVITFDYLLGGPPQLYVTHDAPNERPTLSNYQEFNTEISIPLNFSTSRYSFYMTPSVKHQYRNIYVASPNYYENADFKTDSLNFYKGYASLDYRYILSATSKMAYKNLRPKWGIQYFVTHRDPLKHEQFWDPNTVQLITAHIPGLFRHHSTRMQLGLEDGSGQRMALPRGYTQAYVLHPYNRAQKMSIDYAMPLLYPNLSLGPIAYFKRIYAKGFYDYFVYSNDSYTSSLNSVGIDLSIETNLLRFFWTFVPTIRYSYLADFSEHNFDFMFSTQYGFSLGGGIKHSN